jgi:pimeloyl-ACP methyl ester carboxylesterase
MDKKLTIKNVIVDDQLINYVDAGEGKVVLILHGWGSSNEVFANMIRELAKTYNVIVPDLPGFGGSTEPPEAWGVAEYALWTKKFLQKIKLTPWAILGHSFGGRIILKGVGEKWLTAKRLIFMDAAGVKPKPTAKNKAFAKMSKVGKVLFRGKIGEKIKQNVYQKIGAKDYVNASPLMREVFKKTVAEDLTHYFSNIYLSSLIIWGEDDLDTPLEDAQRFTEIKGAKLVTIKDAGHYVFLDQPQKVFKQVKEFLQ